MLDMIDTKPRKIVFLGPGCSVATKPVAEAAPYWQAVQVSWKELNNFKRKLIIFSLSSVGN